MSSPDRTPRIRKVCDTRICPTPQECQLSSAIENIRKGDSPFTGEEKRNQLQVFRNNIGFKKCRLYPVVFTKKEL